MKSKVKANVSTLRNFFRQKVLKESYVLNAQKRQILRQEPQVWHQERQIWHQRREI